LITVATVCAAEVLHYIGSLTDQQSSKLDHSRGQAVCLDF